MDVFIEKYKDYKISSIYLYKTIVNDKLSQVIFIIISILFILLTIFIYYKFIKPNISLDYVANKEYIDHTNDTSEDVQIILFKTEWCPHCKSAMPEWQNFDSFIQNINNNIDYYITTTIVDCDDNPETAEKYNIEAYPSIILIYKNTVYTYDAKPNKKNLIKFLETSTNKDSPIAY